MSLSSSRDSALIHHRQQFPALLSNTYFNFGGQGPLPQPAMEAIIKAYQHLDQVGPFSVAANQWIEEQTERVRGAIAHELGAPTTSLTLTENVTAGCNIALWAIDWQPGDHLLMTDCEHPGIIGIVSEISRRFQVNVTVCPIQATLNHGDPVAVIESYLQPRTRCVVLSHLLWNTGQILPLKAIADLCHHYPDSQHPIQVMVDAAQSVGSLPLNLQQLGVDYYAFTGHKWCCGPAGVGGLYVRPESLLSLSPTFIGWRSFSYTPQGDIKDWQSDGRRFEVATSATPLLLGLQAAIALHQQWGTAHERYERITKLSSYLWQGLTEISGVHCLKDSAPEAGLVSFQIDGKIAAPAFVQALEVKGFLLRKIAKPDSVRACVHYFTTESEIEQLIDAIKTLLT